MFATPPDGVAGLKVYRGRALHGLGHDVTFPNGKVKYLKVQGRSVILYPSWQKWTSHAKLVGALPKVSHMDVCVCSP